MAGLVHIMLWMFCLYLLFKGVEIFQIAFVSARDGMSRGTGVTLGLIMIIGASVAAVGLFLLEKLMSGQLQH